MCVLYVIWLCAGRIGLGWAYDAIIFARHMLMHFHAYVLYIQYIFICLNCFWDFSECFFLPPHYIVYVSVVMALKCKSAPSRNPLRFGASSFSNPTPSFVWFYDEQAQKDFSENFSRQGVHSERQVILSDFSNTDLSTIIHSWG